MDRHLARHFAVLAETKDDSWPSASPSHALSDLEVGEAAPPSSACCFGPGSSRCGKRGPSGPPGKGP